MKVGYQVLVDLQQQQAFKQWGYLQKQAEKWIYPIPVLEAFIATKTCISNNHSAAGYVGYWTWDKDITTEYAYSWNNYPSYCFMIGKVQQQWGKPTVRGNNIFPIPFPNSALAITSAGIGGWHTVDVSIVNNNSYSVLGWATDSPSTARTSLPNVIAIGF